MLDGVDGPGHLVDGVVDEFKEGVQHVGGRTGPAEIQFKIRQGQPAGEILQQQDDIRGLTDAGRRHDVFADHPDFAVEIENLFPETFFQHDFKNIQVPRPAIGDGPADLLAEAVQQPGTVVDGQGRVIAPEVTGEGIDHRSEMFGRLRHLDDGRGVRGKTVLAFIGDDHRQGFVRPEDGRVLDDVVQHPRPGAGGADDDQRFGGKIDMLLVFHEIRGDRLITEFAQFDADLIGRGLVGSAADHRPVGPGNRQATGHGLDLFLGGEYPPQGGGQLGQLADLAGDERSIAGALEADDIKSQHGRGHHLGIERLGRSHRHLDVPAGTGIKDPVHLEGDIRIPAVDDGDGMGPQASDHIHRPVGVGGRPRLADGDDQGIGHGPGRVPGAGQVKAAQLRGFQGPDGDGRVGQIIIQDVGPGQGGHAGRSLPDKDNPADGIVFQGIGQGTGNDIVREAHTE